MILNILAHSRDPEPGTVAKLPLAKDVDDFDFTGTPVNDSLIRDLAGRAFVADQRNVVLVGGTGTGKSHLAIAIARSLIRNGARGRFFNVVDLVNRLETETHAGRQGRIADHPTRLDLPDSVSAEGHRALVSLPEGRTVSFDTIYPAMGCTMRSKLAIDLGAAFDEAGNLVADSHQRTGIAGLYVAGDVVDEINQIAVAFGHAAIAAVDIHSYLATTE